MATRPFKHSPYESENEVDHAEVTMEGTTVEDPGEIETIIPSNE